MIVKKQVNQFFRELRKKGYVAKQAVGATNSSAWEILHGEHVNTDKVVFYTKQGADAFTKQNELVSTLWLSWSGNGKEIVQIANQCGLPTRWKGTSQYCIGIVPENEEVLNLQSFRKIG
ncbi:hypothetical protein PP175_25830 (plasmid) [Aneurinibacillus sp. Ricciae_BoGa-3]|uniref:DUF6891 domain-containing protein n=1 Tax=Aneurinibacillus sp. Ricciae_BoGa-3 TaxID=3022697 RepID=UPI0023411442|nr:hypothetical protein [Aneurinibacillus sp. Ricciae_BoGa-3]WCK57489.1 hypothetical protein PP175_25830 [Aneurinibacillus sp. Ricciae_BoGa-3]